MYTNILCSKYKEPLLSMCFPQPLAGTQKKCIVSANFSSRLKRLVSQHILPSMALLNMTQTDVLSQIWPRQTFCRRAFCPHGRFVRRMLCCRTFYSTRYFVLRTFYLPDILSVQTFWPAGCFVPPDVLSRQMFCPRTLCLRTFCLRTFCLGTFIHDLYGCSLQVCTANAAIAILLRYRGNLH